MLLSLLCNHDNLVLKLLQKKRSYLHEEWLFIGRFKVGSVPRMRVVLVASKTKQNHDYIPGPALELWQLKIEQFSPGILKCSTKHEDNPLTLNFSKVSRTFLYLFYEDWRGLGSKNFRNLNYKDHSVSYKYGYIRHVIFHAYSCIFTKLNA